jgi:predicted DCC family thiol-disulfide oxidoreductase YuxK
MFSALLKSDAQWIPDGTAFYYVLQLDHMVTPFGVWLSAFPDALQGITYGVWWLEIVGPVLIFSPIFHRTFRTICLGAFITLNLGMAVFLELGLFPLVSLVMNLVFVPGWMWDRMAAAVSRSRSSDLRIYYDEDCVICHKICRLLTVFLMMPGVPVRPAQSDPKAAVLLAINNSWVVSDGADTDYLEWDAVRHLLASSPLFRPLAAILSASPLQILGNKFYQKIARSRSTLSRVSVYTLPWRQSAAKRMPLTNTVAGVCLVFALFQNLTTIPDFSVQMPAELKAVAQSTGLNQNWALFAPHPGLKSAWPVILGELKNNRIVDVYYQRSGIPGWDKPDKVAAIYKNTRWRTFLLSMEGMSQQGKDNSLAKNYAGYLCRSWNETAPPGKELSVFNIYFNVEWSQPDYKKADATNRLIWSQDCFGGS